MSRRIKKRRENKTPYSRLHNLTVNAVRMLIPFCDVLPIVTPEFPIIIVIFLLSYLYLFFDSAIARAGMTALRSIIRGIELIVAIEDRELFHKVALSTLIHIDVEDVKTTVVGNNHNLWAATTHRHYAA